MSDNESPRQNHITLMKVCFHRKWLIAIPLFVGLVISTVACFLMPPSFESYTLIMIEEQNTINPLIQSLAISSSVVQRLQTVREQLLGWNNMVGVIKKTGLERTVQNQQQLEDLVEKMRQRIKVDLTLQNMIRLSYSSNDPQESLEVVKDLSNTFIEENLKSVTKETDVAIEFLKQQLEVYKRKIKESEVAELEEKLNDLKLDATDEHPLVKDLRAKIVMARRELESGKIRLDSQDKQKAAQYRELMRRELDKISTDEQSGRPEDPNTAIYKMFLMDRLDLSVARDIGVNRSIYDMLLQRLETAKITQRLEASKQGTRYTIIDPPRLPLKPSAPNRPLIVVMGFFLGGGFGVALVLGRQMMDQSFLDIEDARQNLGYPVLGAVSRICTFGELEREKDKKIIFIIISIILSGALITGAGLFSLFGR
ncbi:MAG: GNVR domain-containing protein [Deltaproteobacteria bacterium]